MKAGKDQVPVNPDAQTETQEVETTGQNHMIEIAIWTQPQVRRLHQQQGQQRQGQPRHRPRSLKRSMHHQILTPRDSNRPRQQEEVKLQVHHLPQITDLDHPLTHAHNPGAKTGPEIETDPDLEAAMIGHPPQPQGSNPDQTQQVELTTSRAQVPKPSSSPSTVKNMCPGLRKTKSGPSLRSV